MAGSLTDAVAASPGAVAVAPGGGGGDDGLSLAVAADMANLGLGDDRTPPLRQQQQQKVPEQQQEAVTGPNTLAEATASTISAGAAAAVVFAVDTATAADESAAVVITDLGTPAIQLLQRDGGNESTEQHSTASEAATVQPTAASLKESAGKKSPVATGADGKKSPATIDTDNAGQPALNPLQEVDRMMRQALSAGKVSFRLIP